MAGPCVVQALVSRLFLHQSPPLATGLVAGLCLVAREGEYGRVSFSVD